MYIHISVDTYFSWSHKIHENIEVVHNSRYTAHFLRIMCHLLTLMPIFLHILRKSTFHNVHYNLVLVKYQITTKHYSQDTPIWWWTKIKSGSQCTSTINLVTVLFYTTTETKQTVTMISYLLHETNIFIYMRNSALLNLTTLHWCTEQNGFLNETISFVNTTRISHKR